MTDRLPLRWSAIIASLIDPTTGGDSPKRWIDVVMDFSASEAVRSEVDHAIESMCALGLIDDSAVDDDGESLVRATALGRERRAQGMAEAEAVVDARAKTTSQRALRLTPSPTPFDGRAAAAGDD